MLKDRNLVAIIVFCLFVSFFFARLSSTDRRDALKEPAGETLNDPVAIRAHAVVPESGRTEIPSARPADASRQLTVLDDDAEPVRNAFIASCTSKARLFKVTDKKQTDDAGVLILEESHVNAERLSVWARGYIQETIRLTGDGPWTVTLHKGTSATVRVRDSQGRPVAGVPVILSRQAYDLDGIQVSDLQGVASCGPLAVVVVSSDENGNCEFDSLREGDYIYQMGDTDWIESGQQYESRIGVPGPPRELQVTPLFCTVVDLNDSESGSKPIAYDFDGMDFKSTLSPDMFMRLSQVRRLLATNFPRSAIGLWPIENSDIDGGMLAAVYSVTQSTLYSDGRVRLDKLRLSRPSTVSLKKPQGTMENGGEKVSSGLVSLRCVMPDGRAFDGERPHIEFGWGDSKRASFEANLDENIELPVGDYEIVFRKLPLGVSWSPKSFSVSKGQEQAIRVQFSHDLFPVEFSFGGATERPFAIASFRILSQGLDYSGLIPASGPMVAWMPSGMCEYAFDVHGFNRASGVFPVPDPSLEGAMQKHEIQLELR